MMITWIGRVNVREPDALVLRNVWTQITETMDRADEGEILGSAKIGADVLRRKF